MFHVLDGKHESTKATLLKVFPAKDFPHGVLLIAWCDAEQVQSLQHLFFCIVR